MTKGIWTDEKTFIEFSETAVSRRLSEEIASRQTAWDYSGMVGLLPDPDPILAKRGDSAEILDSLTGDAHLCSVIQTRKLGTLKREIKWVAGTEKDNEPSLQAKKLRDDLAADLGELDVYTLVSQILDAPYYGYVPFELSWKPAGGRVKLVGIKAKPHRWFGFDEETNAPKFISQAAPWDGEELPYGKFVFARHFPSYDNPYGLRLLSRCFWPVTFKRGGIKFWVTFAEKFGIPFMLGRYPKGTAAKEQQDMLNKLATMVQSAVAVLPEGSTVEKLGGGSDSKGTSDLFERLISTMDKEISKVIVGQTLTSETSDKGGSLAQGKVHEAVLEDYQNSDQQLVKNVLERIAKIYAEINAAGVIPPVMQWFEDEDAKKEFAERDKALTDTGIKFSKSYYQRQYNLQEDDFAIEAARPFAGKNNAGAGNNFAEGDNLFTPEQQALEDLADKGIAAAAGDLQKNEALILKTVRESTSYEDAMERLLAIYPDLAVDSLTTALEQALVAGEMFGRG